tara:strand:- start:2877 stop:3308 length:432 start_codon:yes stop_codon:yes gene_type:complete
MTSNVEIVHASCVAIAGRGVLILGPSGAGKSTLALQLIALGATLVADDRTEVMHQAGAVIATVPSAIKGLIEARGVGLIKLPDHGAVQLALVVDLSQTETQRLPDPHVHLLQGVALPCLHKCDTAHFPSAITLYMSSDMGVKI